MFNSLESIPTQEVTAWYVNASIDQTTQKKLRQHCWPLTSAVRPHRCVGGWGGRLPADGAERRQLQLCGGALVAITGNGGRGAGWAALLAAAAATVQESSGERLAQTEQQHRSHRRLTEQQQLADQVQDVQGSPGNAGCHVHADDVADVLWNDAEAIEDGQRHHGAVHLALQLDLLLAAAHAGPLRVPDLAGRDQWAANGEQRRQAEVAAEVPPETGAIVGESQDIERVREVGGDPDHTALAWRHIGRVAILCDQLSDQQLGQRQQQSAHPDDGELGRGGCPVLDHLVVHLHVGGCTETIDAQSAQREGRDPERRHLEATETECQVKHRWQETKKKHVCMFVCIFDS